MKDNEHDQNSPDSLLRTPLLDSFAKNTLDICDVINPLFVAK